MPLTRFLSVTSYTHSPKYSLAVSHSCLTAERSSTNSILQAAKLAVSATTHICVLTAATTRRIVDAYDQEGIAREIALRDIKYKSGDVENASAPDLPLI